MTYRRWRWRRMLRQGKVEQVSREAMPYFIKSMEAMTVACEELGLWAEAERVKLEAVFVDLAADVERDRAQDAAASGHHAPDAVD